MEGGPQRRTVARLGFWILLGIFRITDKCYAVPCMCSILQSISCIVASYCTRNKETSLRQSDHEPARHGGESHHGINVICKGLVCLEGQNREIE